MDVSVCIPTRNRPDDLVACIGSIVMSSIGVSQIVVADDSTDDRTRDLIESRCSFVTYVPGPRQGLGANRNAAIDAANNLKAVLIAAGKIVDAVDADEVP